MSPYKSYQNEVEDITIWALVNHYAGTEIPYDEFTEAIEPATRKLNDLINRFGDDNGKRRKPEYLAQLINERIRSNRCARAFIEMSEFNRELDKKRSTPKSAPKP